MCIDSGVCECLCMSKRERKRVYVCAYVCVKDSVSVCVYVFVRECVSVSVYLYVCVCFCICDRRGCPGGKSTCARTET